jgi:carbonic anhydrase
MEIIKSKYNIDSASSYMIGDHPSDIIFGKRAGFNTIYVLTGHGKKHRDELSKKTAAFHVTNNINSALIKIKRNLYMKLIKITKESDIPQKYFSSPVGDFLRYNNLGFPFKKYNNAELLIGMCMDNRKHLNIPDNFAYIIRTGGANLRYSEFKVSYAIAISKIRHIILIAHNHCGMVNLVSKRDLLVEGLMEVALWDRERAESHFLNYAPMFEIDNEIEFVIAEAKRLRGKYNITVVPMFYNVENGEISLIDEE